jgi:hypothetical protein
MAVSGFTPRRLEASAANDPLADPRHHAGPMSGTESSSSLSPHPHHRMESYRSSRVSDFWRRLGELVERSRRRPQRLPVALDPLPARRHPVIADGALASRYPDNVRRSVYGDVLPATRRPGPLRPQSAWPMGEPRSGPVQSLGATRYWTARHGDAVTARFSIDCE